MTIYTKLTINGTEYKDDKTVLLSRTIGDSNASSNIRITLDSPYGRHKNDFIVGQEIIYYASNSANPTNIIFRGIVEKISFIGEGTTQTVDITGRDYSLRLQDITVKPIVFTNTEVSDIVKNILTNNNVPDITTDNVQTTFITLPRIAFQQIPIFDALVQLASLASPEGYLFYVDNSKDLHFEPKSSPDSGVTIDNTNILNSDFDTSRQGMSNIVYVYGDRYLDAYKETFTAGSPVGGSVFTLFYKPNNTQVTVAGATVQPGGVLNMQDTASGIKYLVSYDNKQIIFTSGTSQGSNVPASGANVVVNYQRDLPIIKQGQNDASIALYGPKELKVQDNSIKDPRTATSILRAKLQDADPLNRINCRVHGWYDLNPGDLISINLDNFGLIQNVNIIQIDYNFDKESIQSENIMGMTLSRKFIDITDKIKELKSAIDKLQSQSLQQSDVVSRLITSNDMIDFTGSRWNIYTQTIGSSFILGDIITSGTGPGTYDPLLKHYWKFNDLNGSVTSNDINASYGGSIFGNPLFTSGIIGSAFSFNGSNQYITIPSSTDFDLSGSPFTISFWAKIDAYPPSTEYRTLLSRYKWTFGGLIMDYYNDGTKIYTRATDGYVVVSGPTVPLNEWGHYCWTANGTNVPGSIYTFYINGSLVGSGFQGANLPPTISPYPLDLMNFWYQGTRYYFASGAMDELRIYHYSLPIGSVQAICNSGAPMEYTSGTGTIVIGGRGLLGSYADHSLGFWGGAKTLIQSGT